MVQKGRKPYVPTAESRVSVKTLTSYGIPHDHIALVMQISAPTLRKHYRHELDTGKIEATIKVAKSLFGMATHKTRPHAGAGIFWMKVHAGWRETERVEVSGRDGEAIEQKVGLALVDEKQIASALKRLEAEY
ncbi:hypothetical protein [Xylella fastidiosa]|uniref:Uncharacterized protein n=2 Tax=Xylella fastidiosa TaxID=2371 RepID=A0A9Q4MGV5_XYLFS|nr:hypothetical protein [Xylella fastidiosa]KAJ4851830.1 hypothetical protein XYFPCFBP8418_007885 [Xylella fastidiosa subsp. multiplex]MBE0269967.1 hypothetical protein [Xylella fastidiosa subsp. multiplex]MBE0276572.1 hypothetical protein [Xylella fastidiosa subsp. multiplex]MBE0278765.1 hypothetical protein [Xylella fastidiosa subsp. multiplex]MBE0283185.1 hypothetical protein [Xylella fastidiosa subsp. multiplex]